MSKQAALRNADDTDALNPYAGELAEDGTLLQSGLFKNTGDVALTSVTLKVENTAALPAAMTVTVNGVLLSEAEETEVLSDPLAPGESVPVLLTWAAGATVLNGEDSGVISGTVS